MVDVESGLRVVRAAAAIERGAVGATDLARHVPALRRGNDPAASGPKGGRAPGKSFVPNFETELN